MFRIMNKEAPNYLGADYMENFSPGWNSNPLIDTRAGIFSPKKRAEIFRIIDNKFQPVLEMNEKISARAEIAILSTNISARAENLIIEI